MIALKFTISFKEVFGFMKKHIACCLASIVILSLITGCGGNKTDGPKDSSAATEADSGNGSAEAADTILIGRQKDPTDLDPTSGNDYESTRMYHSIIEGLVTVDENGELIPDLAKEWEISDDGLVWTFHLIPGLKFSDGTDVTIDDWKFTFDRAKNTEESYWKYTAENIVSVEGDNETLTITLENENPATLAYLSLFNMGVQSKAHFEEIGSTYDDGWPVGCGAYYVDEWKHDEYVNLKANPYYYKEGYPKTENIKFVTVPDDSSRTMMLQSGELDIATDIPYSSAETVDAVDGISIVAYPSTNCRYIVMNGAANEALAKTEVRQALMLGTDFQQIIDMSLYGYGQITKSYLSPMQNSYNDDLPDWEYDTEKAKEALAAAGYPNGFDVTMTVASGNALFEQLGTLLQDQWSKIGVKVNIESLDIAALRDKQYNMELELLVGSWTDDMPDPSQLTQYILDYDNSYGFYTNWKSEKANELFAQASKEMDDTKREALYKEIQKICRDEVVLPAFFNADEIVGQSDKITGFSQTPYGTYFLDEAVKTK